MSQFDSDSKESNHVLPSQAEAASPSTELTEVSIPVPIRVQELARLTHQKPFRLIADLMEQNLFVTLNDTIDFAPAFKVLLKYGLLANKA